MKHVTNQELIKYINQSIKEDRCTLESLYSGEREWMEQKFMLTPLSNEEKRLKIEYLENRIKYYENRLRACLHNRSKPGATVKRPHSSWV